MQLKESLVQYMQANFNGEFRIGVVEALPCELFNPDFGFKAKFKDGDGELGTGGDDVL